MDENRTEVIEVTEEIGTEDGMEKKFDVEGVLGTVAIGAGAIAIFEGGKFVVKKLKEPAKKGFGWLKSKLGRKEKDENVEVSEPDHEEPNTEANEKTEAKKSDKSKK